VAAGESNVEQEKLEKEDLVYRTLWKGSRENQ